MKFLVLFILCLIGAIAEVFIPVDWKYLFGYLVGGISATVIDMFFYDRYYKK